VMADEKRRRLPAPFLDRPTLTGSGGRSGAAEAEKL
jgi:hypothetical protein